MSEIKDMTPEQFLAALRAHSDDRLMTKPMPAGNPAWGEINEIVAKNFHNYWD